MKPDQRDTIVSPANLFKAVIVVAAGAIALGANLEPTLSFQVRAAVCLILVPLVAAALSSNLLGAVFGGFLEYASMLFGFQALYVIGGVIYLAAFLTSVRLSRSAH